MNLHIEHIKTRLGNQAFHYNARVTHGITGVFGLSGSGKTTLMNIISGVLSPNSGKLVFNNTVLFDSSSKINVPQHKRNIGVVFQDLYLFPHLTVKKNLLFALKHSKKRKQYIRLETVTDLLDLHTLMHKKTAMLSGGERQRVAIGRTLLSQPELLLMDEPFSNLDTNRRSKIISYLLKINHQFNIPMMVISHDLEDLLKLTKSLLIVKDGEIQAHNSYLSIADSGVVPLFFPYR